MVQQIAAGLGDGYPGQRCTDHLEEDEGDEEQEDDEEFEDEDMEGEEGFGGREEEIEITEEDLRAEEEGSSALGSIGLKPKIVH